MSTNKSIRETRNLAQSLGLKCELVSKNKHIKLRLIAPDGRTAIEVLPTSASDTNFIKNRDARIKRFARGGAA